MQPRLLACLPGAWLRGPSHRAPFTRARPSAWPWAGQPGFLRWQPGCEYQTHEAAPNRWRWCWPRYPASTWGAGCEKKRGEWGRGVLRRGDTLHRESQGHRLGTAASHGTADREAQIEQFWVTTGSEGGGASLASVGNRSRKRYEAACGALPLLTRTHIVCAPIWQWLANTSGTQRVPIRPGSRACCQRVWATADESLTGGPTPRGCTPSQQTGRPPVLPDMWCAYPRERFSFIASISYNGGPLGPDGRRYPSMASIDQYIYRELLCVGAVEGWLPGKLASGYWPLPRFVSLSGACL